MLLSSEKIARLWDVVGWTMVHFLWTGLIVLLLTLVVRMMARRRSAQTRYAAMLGCFTALAVLPCLLIVLVANHLPVAVDDETPVIWQVSTAELTVFENQLQSTAEGNSLLQVEVDLDQFDMPIAEVPLVSIPNTQAVPPDSLSFVQVEINPVEIHPIEIQAGDATETTHAQQFFTLLFNTAKHSFCT